MFLRFFDWALDLKPSWVGFVVWASAVFTISFSVFFGAVLLIETFGVWVLLVVPMVVLYAWIKAIFFQPDKEDKW